MFTPNYQLWSDASNKSRWIYLPPNQQIHVEDPDGWVFPVGTQIFKEFRQTPKHSDQEIRVETRHLHKINEGEGVNAWQISTYQWNEAQTDAYLSQGQQNVLKTDHDIPTRQHCIDCHKGNKDFILGFEAIQLSDQQGRYAFGHGPKRQTGEWTLHALLAHNKLTERLEVPVLPGNELEQKALGYLHANCGNCHNPLGHAAENEAGHLKFKHLLRFDSVEDTDVYTTAVNQPTRNFTSVPYIILGAERDELALYHSAVFVRMNSFTEEYRMPMIAREKVDYLGLDLIHRWIQSLPTPGHIEFHKKSAAAQSAPAEQTLAPNSVTTHSMATKGGTLTSPTAFLNEVGLQLQMAFYRTEYIPSVMAVYWPEDDGLDAQPIMDHQDGHFTEKLILGRQGSLMSLRNSDEVGHTIYVKDKKQNVKWQLSYMPPNSSFEQELFWPEDVFVEMKCRLHLYMSAWAGSIKSRYFNVMEFGNKELIQYAEMNRFPEEFTQLKIWLPNFEPIETRIAVGDTQEFELIKGHVVVGTLRLKRFAQK